ncbi:MAG TPA: hypothetical protein ENK23_05255, partial [Sorangium sp.]|nr:hypothetical protein [Sorangium sp.]
MGQKTFLSDMPADPFQRRVGQRLAPHWTIEHLLGAGGMAAVYRVRSDDGRLAAAKILHGSMARNAEVRARFVQEAQAVSRIDHPAMVRIFG